MEIIAVGNIETQQIVAVFAATPELALCLLVNVFMTYNIQQVILRNY